MEALSSSCQPSDITIGDHGIIGNLETVALVALDGAIDFFCFPRFDSPSLFARLVGGDDAGQFKIAPTATDMVCRQMYLPDTNVLMTRFQSDNGILEIMDFMLPTLEDEPPEIVRIVKAIHGDINVEMTCRTAFDYGRSKCEISLSAGGHQAHIQDKGSDTSTRLLSTVELSCQDHEVHARFDLKQQDIAVFRYVCGNAAFSDEDVDPDRIERDALTSLDKVIAFWRDWISQSTYAGHWPAEVKRSALVLKLLFSRQYGSIVAAPTFSLPEAIGGERNWDYRFCWIRDSAFTIYAMMKLGFSQEVIDYLSWVSARFKDNDSGNPLHLMYRVDGSNDITETILDHMPGYKDSTPVRIGNAAVDQLQLDIHGELIDSIYLAHKFSTPTSHDGWLNISRTIEYVISNWDKPDEGIWEMRGGKKHFLHSRLMCWVAIDRGIRLAEKASYPAPLNDWRKVRDRIYNDIHDNFFDEDLNSFVQHRGSKVVDAALMLMPMVKFISPVDERWLGTLEKIQKDLATDTFVRRYLLGENDIEGLDGSEEGSFTMCSFWLVEVLARSGQVDEARLMFEKLLGYANHVGLFAEQLSVRGDQQGNFPQAFTHLALISAAVAIDRAIDNGGQPF
ncbi:glycoside hydrolase family 15 protein [Parvularcula sp. LCG005]|uniref:glycoside hydrolase family 15 protein n=1 Tax=Parvularcula sp. LCG005 TaxID=3078805 RepID=UPI0029433D6E|nr:glycoside hydrolase family 15 protein [Parvularcula sp. LCG005]WOI54683.1 glycoside hydrolase family 15 protein [Parvularcula sp. LCG005]